MLSGRRADEAASADRRERIRKAALAAGTLALAGALFAYGISASCPPSDPEPAAIETGPTDAGAERDSVARNFYGTENWTFMSGDSMRAFQESFYAWLLEGGLEDGAYVYLHGEDVACEGGIWTAYARTPVNDAYYKVAFDAETKGCTFEEVLKPEFAEKAESERTVVDATATDAPQVAGQDSTAPPDRRDASANIALDDPTALGSLLPSHAAEALPGIIAEYCAGKGVDTSPGLCSVYPASIDSTGGAVRFDVLVYDSQKRAYVVSADYDAASDRFGLSLKAL